MLPKLPKAFNVFAEDGSWAGRFDNVTVGKLSRILEDYRGGGMNAAVKVDLGYEMPEMEITLKEYTQSLIRSWGECETDGKQWRLLAGAKGDGPGCPVDNIEIVYRGRPSELDLGSWKQGDLTDFKGTIVTSYFKLAINNETLIELDPVNMVETIGGVDRFEKLRDAIGV